MKFITVIKFVGSILLGYTVILLEFLFYPFGIMFDFVMIPFLLFLVYVNYKAASKLWTMIFLDINLTVSVCFAVTMATQLYYKNISSDGLTIAVGEIMTILSATCVVVASLIFVAVRSIPSFKSKLKAMMKKQI